MSRTPSCLDGRRAMALLVVGAVLVTCPEAARVAIASWDSSEANLDYAVRVEPGARGREETSVPEAHRQVPWTLEGWFRSAAKSARVLIDVQHAGGRRPRVQTKEATEAVDSPAVRADVWTRYTRQLDLEGARLWPSDVEHRERSAVLAPCRLGSAPSRLRAGLGGGWFRGLADAVRVWGAELSAPQLRGWRHRGVTLPHPGPMRMRDAHGLALPSLHCVPLLRNMDSGSVRVLLGVRGADGPCHDCLPMIDGRRGFDGVRKDL